MLKIIFSNYHKWPVSLTTNFSQRELITVKDKWIKSTSELTSPDEDPVTTACFSSLALSKFPHIFAKKNKKKIKHCKMARINKSEPTPCDSKAYQSNLKMGIESGHWKTIKIQAMI